MLHSKQFTINEAWIVFRINDAPIGTDADGAFNCLALMDAASCFILGSEFIAADQNEPTELEFSRLLKQGENHQQQLPKDPGQNYLVNTEGVPERVQQGAICRQ